MKNSFFRILVFFLVSSLSFTSCEKEQEREGVNVNRTDLPLECLLKEVRREGNLYAEYQYYNQQRIVKRLSYDEEEMIKSETTYDYIFDKEIEIIFKGLREGNDLSLDSKTTTYLDDEGNIEKTLTKSFRSNRLIKYEYTYTENSI